MIISDDKLYEQLGARLRAIRENNPKKYTQAELARLVGVERTSITNIENGNQKVPLHLLYRLCAVLDVVLSEVLPPIEVVKNNSIENVEIGGTNYDLPPKAADVIHRLVGS